RAGYRDALRWPEPVRVPATAAFRTGVAGSAGPGVAHLGELTGQRGEVTLALELLAHRREAELRPDLLPPLEQDLIEQQFLDILVCGPKLVHGRLVPLNPFVQVSTLVIGHVPRLGGNEPSSC